MVDFYGKLVDKYTTRGSYMGVEPKIGGKPPKMDGENHGSKPYEQMDVPTPIFGWKHPYGYPPWN